MDAEAEGPRCREIYFRCVHCNQLYEMNSGHEQHPNGCPLPLPHACFTCGTPPPHANFSTSQLNKLREGERARCTACIDAGTTKRFAAPLAPSLNEELTEAVGEGDVERVRALLQQGANANYVRQLSVRHYGSQAPIFRAAFSADGTAIPEDDPECVQPTTPLKLVGFRVSDCMLTEAQLWQFKDIADMLISHGAQARLALAHMEQRYGAWSNENEDDGTAFTAIFRTVFNAANG
jgi:hypothetical protein